MRMMPRLVRFLSSPLAEDPFVRVGNQRVLRPEASPPSIYVLQMLAHMPLFRREWGELMAALATYLARPAPVTAPAIAAGKAIVPTPHLVLGDPLASERVAADDVGWAVTWLELVARLGLLRSGSSWLRVFERLLDECGPDGVWRPKRTAAVARTTNPFVWPSFPLEAQLVGDARFTDVTFRLGLIARLAGWQIEAA
jgi:hypothetical protein